MTVTVDELWHAVMAGDEYTARDVATSALTSGMPAETVLLDVIGAVQLRLGTEWAAARINVTQEHAATAINERVIAALPLHLDRPTVRYGRVTVACVDGEWHALPARLLAETLTLRGFAVDYLGAQVPAPHLIAHLHRVAPDAVALSSSIQTRLPAAHATITACQAAGVPVIVGGAAFGVDGRYARLLGAQAWAPDARAAADRLAREPLTRPLAVQQPIDTLPHLADQEYSLVTRSAPALVAAVHGEEYAAEDAAQLVEFLATSLYIGDDDLFTGFLTWTADVRSARDLPPTTLRGALDRIAAELPVLPRASRLLAAGIDHVDRIVTA